MAIDYREYINENEIKNTSDFYKNNTGVANGDEIIFTDRRNNVKSRFVFRGNNIYENGSSLIVENYGASKSDTDKVKLFIAAAKK